MRALVLRWWDQTQIEIMWSDSHGRDLLAKIYPQVLKPKVNDGDC